MVRTIKENHGLVPSIQSGELLPRAAGNLKDVFNGFNGNQQVELLNNATNVVQEVMRTRQASEQRKAVEAECRRDVLCSDNDVKKARIDYEKHCRTCELEKMRLLQEIEQARMAHEHKMELTRKYQKQSRDCWEQYKQTGDVNALHIMQQTILATNKE